MAVWNDLLLRLNLSDNGTYPNRPGVPCESPDVIPYGVQPIDNWQSFFAGNYGSDVGKNVVVNQDKAGYKKEPNQHFPAFAVVTEMRDPEAFAILSALAQGATLENACADAIAASNRPNIDWPTQIKEWFDDWGVLGWLCRP